MLRRSALVPDISTRAAFRNPVMPDGSTSSSSGSRKGGCFRHRRKTRFCWTIEREGISTDLRLSTDRIDEAVYAVLMRLAASAASVTFSYSCRDTREFRETYASWLMLQAFRLQQRRRHALLSRDEGRAWRAEVRRT